MLFLFWWHLEWHWAQHAHLHTKVFYCHKSIIQYSVWLIHSFSILLFMALVPSTENCGPGVLKNLQTHFSLKSTNFSYTTRWKVISLRSLKITVATAHHTTYYLFEHRNIHSVSDVSWIGIRKAMFVKSVKSWMGSLLVDCLTVYIFSRQDDTNYWLIG